MLVTPLATDVSPTVTGGRCEWTLPRPRKSKLVQHVDVGIRKCDRDQARPPLSVAVIRSFCNSVTSSSRASTREPSSEQSSAAVTAGSLSGRADRDPARTVTRARAIRH